MDNPNKITLATLLSMMTHPDILLTPDDSFEVVSWSGDLKNATLSWDLYETGITREVELDETSDISFDGCQIRVVDCEDNHTYSLDVYRKHSVMQILGSLPGEIHPTISKI